jgi:quinoprotein glucose dehydrogenase
MPLPVPALSATVHPTTVPPPQPIEPTVTIKPVLPAQPLLALLVAAALCAALPALPAGAAEAGHGVDGPAVTSSPKLDKEADHIKSLTLPAGTQAQVWVQGEEAANPVAIAVDGRNRLFAAETMRFRVGGVLDAREHLWLYKDDLKLTTTAERAAMYEKYAGKYKPGFFSAHAERVMLFEDTKGAGVADRSRVFAGGFNDPLDGTASGIVTGDDGTVYLACIPKIWALGDSTGSGVSDKRSVVSEGYGVRVSISGHDLHGLVWGPDGKLYWSMGDRGYNVTGKEGQHFADPVGGGVFRANPDGSELELIYTGLRNPEELAFNEFGDLFTVDNNADFGDKSRINYILEGGNTGWSHGWSLLNINSFAKAAGLDGVQPDPWMVEELWKTRFPEQPAYILPAVGYCTAGPCGLAYMPATGWPADWQGRFLVCDYRSGNDSGIWWFTVKQDGAGYTVPKVEKFLWGAPVTDVAFSYDGRLFVSEYLGGWSQSDKGRIISLWAPGEIKAKEVAEVAALFAAGFRGRPLPELAKLLEHADQRVRQASQFELARRGAGSVEILATAARSGSQLARLHGIWGLGQLGRSNPEVLKALLPLMTDKDVQVRSQAIKVLGDDRYAACADQLVAGLRDASMRVRAFAAIALGRLHQKSTVPALVRMLADNDDDDAFLRHAAVMGLAGTNDAPAVEAYASDRSKAVRLGVLLAERRMADPHIAAFLQDADALVAAEAVRAIYDLPIKEAMPQLIACLDRPLNAQLSEPMAKLLYLRMVNAAYRYGDAAAAVKLAEFAASSTAPEEVRARALETLLHWAKPTTVDPVVGLYRPIMTRDQPIDGALVKDAIMRIVKHGEEKLLPTAVALAAQFGYGLDEGVLLAIVDNSGMAEPPRTAAISQLQGRGSKALLERLPKLLGDDSGAVRIAAYDALVALTPGQAAATAKGVLDGATSSAHSEAMVVSARTEGEWDALPMRAPQLGALCDSSGMEISWVKGLCAPHKDAGAKGQLLPRLSDTELPLNDDDVKHNVWFDGAAARFVLDLKKAVEVERVNTYSWHKSNRAAQQFTLWGASGDTLPDPAAANLGKGWKRIAAADTTSLGEGGKHGVAIQAGSGSLGSYRWLLWQLPSRGAGTFFSKVCVFAHGRVLPPLVQVVSGRTDGDWGELPMGAPVVDGGSDSAAANGASAAVVAGMATPDPLSGALGAKLPRLTDALLPANNDDTAHSTWFDGESYRFTLDLGKALELERINTYSWHRDGRAPQAWVLWGAAGAALPDAAGDLAKAGWARLAQVDTSSLGEGGKHGVCVLAGGGSLGTYRWLLWQSITTTPVRSGTFFAKLNVFAKGRTLPPLNARPDPAVVALKQHALSSLAKLSDAASAEVVNDWLDRLIAGKAPPELALETIEAAASRSEPALAAKLKQYQAGFPVGDQLAPFRSTLWGGDAERGRTVFRFHNAQCMRCHAVDGDGGVVGPDLRGVPNRISHEAILESLILPNAVIAPGFGTAIITLKDGSSVSGSILSQNTEQTLVRLADLSKVTIPAAKIATMSTPVSPMPPMGPLLTKGEMRDVIAYLTSLK